MTPQHKLIEYWLSFSLEGLPTLSREEWMVARTPLGADWLLLYDGYWRAIHPHDDEPYLGWGGKNSD